MPYGPNYTLTPAICVNLNTLDYMETGHYFKRHDALDDEKKTQNNEIYHVQQLPQRKNCFIEHLKKTSLYNCSQLRDSKRAILFGSLKSTLNIAVFT